MNKKRRNHKPHSKDMMTRMMDLYPDTGGRTVIHNENGREWEIKSVFRDVQTDGTIDMPDAPGDCVVNLILATQLPYGPALDEYICDGFCCDNSSVDGMPIVHGDGVVDINTRDWYENNGWSCHSEHYGWACENANGDIVSYDVYGPNQYNPGCYGLDVMACAHWERRGYCKAIDVPANMDCDTCIARDGTMCINAVDNMARKVHISNDIMHPFVINQIQHCCNGTCGDMNIMWCDTEEGIGFQCICPGACPSGGYGPGNTACAGCNEPIENNQDDACEYPYYNGYECVTPPGTLNYVGTCRN